LLLDLRTTDIKIAICNAIAIRPDEPIILDQRGHLVKSLIRIRHRRVNGRKKLEKYLEEKPDDLKP